MMGYSNGSAGTLASTTVSGAGMMGSFSGIGSGTTSGVGLGAGMMGGSGTSSMLSIMQGVLSGGATGSATVTGMMQGMLDIMDDFLPGNSSANASGSTNIFQSMAAAMSQVFTGSANAPASFQPMLDAMHGFLSSATAGSSTASGSFQTMLDAMQTFLTTGTSGTVNVSVPFQAMLGAMQTFLSNTASGSTSASSSFQTMLGAMQTVLGDTNVLSGPVGAHTLNVQADGSVQVTGTDGISHMLTNMERLHFSDASVALDINGNAGTTAKILGLVFGPDSVANKAYVGMGLNLLDGGMSYQDAMQAALNAKLGPSFSTADEVNLAYQNLFGTRPTASEMSYWENAVASGQFTHASLAVMAAETGLNAEKINLIGLAHTGLEYLPVS